MSPCRRRHVRALQIAELLTRSFATRAKIPTYKVSLARGSEQEFETSAEFSFSLSLYLSLQKCSTQLPEKRQCDQMDSNGTKEQAYPPSCPTPLIPWPPLAGEVDEGIGQASMLAGRPTHLFDNPVSGTIVLAFDARCVKYHRIIYNYIYILYIHIVLYCITVSVNSYSDGIYPVHRTYVYYVK